MKKIYYMICYYFYYNYCGIKNKKGYKCIGISDDLSRKNPCILCPYYKRR